MAGYKQILIVSEDQENTIFTCSSGTYDFKVMLFGLSNALMTFKMCMMTIFHDKLVEFAQVSMDDLSL